MSFLKEFKEDLTQAVNELVTDETGKTEEAANAEASEDKGEENETMDDEMVNTLDDEVIADLDLDAISDLIGTDGQTEENEKAEEKPEDKKEAFNTYDDNEVPSEEVTEITKGTAITGNISSNGSINIYGKIIGDVSCKGKMVITGNVQGTSSAGEIFANNSKIEGDVRSEGSIKIGNGSVIMGNVYATSAVIGGAVKGDIDVHGPVIVDATAVIQGNIKSRSVQINNGAAIEGFCSQCYADVDYKALFDDTFGK